MVKTIDDNFDKLADRINKFIDELHMNNTLEVHGMIDQFNYMQKVAEMETLRNSLDETLKRSKLIKDTLETCYRDLFTKWSKDARWLNCHLISSKSPFPAASGKNPALPGPRAKF